MVDFKGEIDKSLIVRAIINRDHKTLEVLTLALYDIARDLVYRDLHDGFGSQAGDLTVLTTRDLTDRIKERLK